MNPNTNVPFWQQTLSFTCDPACLLMAMKVLDPSVTLSKELELEIWRESYGIGIPGCLPQGLAYSALKRGFQAAIICPDEELFTVGTIAEGENTKVTVWTSKDLFEKAVSLGLKHWNKQLALDDLSNALNQGAVPLVMINMFRLHNINSPHWIVITKITSQDVTFHDPYIKTGQNTKLSVKEFQQLLQDLEKKFKFAARAALISKD